MTTMPAASLFFKLVSSIPQEPLPSRWLVFHRTGPRRAISRGSFEPAADAIFRAGFQRLGLSSRSSFSRTGELEGGCALGGEIRSVHADGVPLGLCAAPQVPTYSLSGPLAGMYCARA